MGGFYGYKRYGFGILCKNCDHHSDILLALGEEAVKKQIRRSKNIKFPEEAIISENIGVQYRIFPNGVYKHQINADMIVSDAS